MVLLSRCGLFESRVSETSQQRLREGLARVVDGSRIRASSRTPACKLLLRWGFALNCVGLFLEVETSRRVGSKHEMMPSMDDDGFTGTA